MHLSTVLLWIWRWPNVCALHGILLRRLFPTAFLKVFMNNMNWSLSGMKVVLSHIVSSERKQSRVYYLQPSSGNLHQSLLSIVGCNVQQYHPHLSPIINPISEPLVDLEPNSLCDLGKSATTSSASHSCLWKHPQRWLALRIDYICNCFLCPVQRPKGEWLIMEFPRVHEFWRTLGDKLTSSRYPPAQGIPSNLCPEMVDGNQKPVGNRLWIFPTAGFE